MKRLFGIGILLLIAGCSDSSNVTLIDNNAWVFASTEADDPFRSETGASSSCSSTSYEVEEGTGFTVQTEDCPYITVRQTLKSQVRSEESITVNVFHYRLTAPDPGEAHLALAFGSDVVWETAIPIPSNSGAIVETFQVPKEYPKDTPILFHLHNHGQNAYSLVELFLGTL